MRGKDRSVLLRADSGLTRGYGHVMRCQTLGAELRRRGWNVTLMSEGIDPFLLARAERLGIGVIPTANAVGSPADLAAIRERAGDVVILDSYEFTQDFIRKVVGESTWVVLVDDNGFAEESDVDLVLNQNIHASAARYPRVDPDRLLLGLGFALIRDEVRAFGTRGLDRPVTDRRTILVAVGGTDVLGLAPRIAEALLDQVDCEVIVAGSVVPEGCRASEPDIAGALSVADLAIIGAGTTMWEALCLGSPALALIVADNQVEGARHAEEADLISSVDCRNLQSVYRITEVVSEMISGNTDLTTRSRRGMAVVDGEGVRRVADAIEYTVGS